MAAPACGAVSSLRACESCIVNECRPSKSKQWLKSSPEGDNKIVQVSKGPSTEVSHLNSSSMMLSNEA